MSIPDKALAILAREVIISETIHEYPSDASREDLLAEWETVPEDDRAIIRERLRPALEAAMPFIEAAILHEQARTWGTTVDQYGRSIASHIHRDARIAEYGARAS